MFILIKAIIRLNAIPIKIPMACFTEVKKKNQKKIYKEPQNTPNSLKKKSGEVKLKALHF